MRALRLSRLVVMILLAGSMTGLLSSPASAETTVVLSPALDLSDLPAPSGTVTSSGVATAGLAGAPGGGSCNFFVNAAFQGQREARTRVASGSWLHYGSIECTFLAAELYVNTTLRQNGNDVGYDFNYRNNNNYVTASNTMVCSICNGQWQAFSQYEVKLPIGYVWLDHPAGCYTDTTMTHLYCNLATRLVNI